MRERTGTGLALLLWEAFWGYVYFNAPVPDEKMVTVLALLADIAIPVWLALAALCAWWISRSVRDD